MRGFQTQTKRKAHATGYASGGMVRGPGTGISDDVPDQVPEGTYIMPADSTAQLGPDKLAGMGARGFKAGGKKAAGGKSVPVNLSNGEFKMPPEQVHAIGVQALDRMKDATHTPVAARGFAPGARQQAEPPLFFADGGVVDDEAGQELPEWSRGQMSYGDQMRNLGQALLNVPKHIVSAPGYGFNQDTPAAKPAGAQTGQQPLPSGVAPSTAGAGRGAINPPLANPGAAAPESPKPPSAPPPVSDTAQASNQRMLGVYEHGRGQYSDNAAGMGFAPAFTGRPNAQNMAAADALAGRDSQRSMGAVLSAQQPQTPAVQAPTALHSGNSWQARNDLRHLEVAASSIAHQSGRVTNDRGRVINPGVGDNGAREAYLAAVKNDLATRGAQPGLDAAAMRENAGIQREGMQQDGANAREQGRNILARDEFNLRKEASGFQTRAAQRLENLQNSYQSAKTPEERAAIAQQLRELQSKDAPARYKVAAGGQQIDANGVAYRTPDRIFNEQTGVFSDGAGAAPAPQALPPKDQLKAGQTYSTPRGQARWDGNQFIPV